jgi:hypothetical protein
MHFVSACYFCHQFHLVRPLVLSPIGLDSILTSSHRGILLGLLCLLAFIGTGTGALSMGVYHVSISPRYDDIERTSNSLILELLTWWTCWCCLICLDGCFRVGLQNQIEPTRVGGRLTARFSFHPGAVSFRGAESP